MASNLRTPPTNTQLSQPDIDWILGLLGDAGGSITNIGSILSGVSARANQAQATATGAANGVNNLNQQVVDGGAVPMTVSSDGDAIGSGFGAGIVVTNAVTFTPTGGISPYSYSTIVVGAGINPENPTAGPTGTPYSTAFDGFVGSGEAFYTTAECTVTDSTPGTPLVAKGYCGIAISSDPGS